MISIFVEMHHHEKYMTRCLELAEKGFGKVAPNPMVGCVIVQNNKVIGEGWHKQYGKEHAEVNAIDFVRTRHIGTRHVGTRPVVSLLHNATLYVNLEPCSHFGKTPPCADLIIRNKIKHVVIGTLDPNPSVGGKGIHKLASSGCDVKVGVMEDECKKLNKRFFTFHEKKRPYIILKWAETNDKIIGIKNKKLKITNERADIIVHRWRSEEQAIMVGTNTALTDNPKLTVRKVKGKNPLRVVIDKDLKIPSHFHLLDCKVPTLVFTSPKESFRTRQKLSKKNLEYIKIDFSERRSLDKENALKQILDELYKRNILSLIVEGGAILLNSFIKKNLWDEAKIITSKNKLSQFSKNGNRVMSPKISGKLIERKNFGSDSLRVLRNTS